MESYFHQNEIDKIRTKLSGCEINRIEKKIEDLSKGKKDSDEAKRRVYQNYYNRKVRVGKNLFLSLLLLYIIFLIFTIPCRFNNNNLDPSLVLNSLGNRPILLTNKPCKQSFYQDNFGYFELTDNKNILSLKIKTNILFLTQESSCDSSKLIRSNDIFTLSKKDTTTLFCDSNKYFTAELKDQTIQLSLQPNHILIGAKKRMSNLALYSYSLGGFLFFGALLYVFFICFGIRTKNIIYDKDTGNKELETR